MLKTFVYTFFLGFFDEKKVQLKIIYLNLKAL